jgi:tetratricopeptide (TPR) repeat protein
VSSQPKNADDVYQLGLKEWKSGNFDKAIKLWDLATKHNHPDAMWRMGLIACELEELQDAKDYWLRALAGMVLLFAILVGMIYIYQKEIVHTELNDLMANTPCGQEQIKIAH